MNKHDCFIQEAILEAKKSNMSHRHGCVIIHKTKIIARGHNKVRNLNYKIRSQHAEVAAIFDMKKNRENFENVIMFVVRIKNGDMDKQNDSVGTKNSKPCMNCEKSIIASGIKRVYFTCSDS